MKTDRRDAEKLARCHRAGELTAVCSWVPDAAHEALRDLVRAARSGQESSTSASPPFGEIPAASSGKRPTDAGEVWTQKYLNWIPDSRCASEQAAAGRHAGALPGGSGNHIGERIAKLEQSHRRSGGKQACARNSGRDRSLAGVTRSGADDRCYSGFRAWQAVPVFQPEPVDGIQRPGVERTFERRPRGSAGRNHQDR